MAGGAALVRLELDCARSVEQWSTQAGQKLPAAGEKHGCWPWSRTKQHIAFTEQATAVSLSCNPAEAEAALRAPRARASTDEGRTEEASRKLQINRVSTLYNAESKNSQADTNWTRRPWAEGTVPAAPTA